MAHGENIIDPRYAYQGLRMNHVTCGKTATTPQRS